MRLDLDCGSSLIKAQLYPQLKNSESTRQLAASKAISVFSDINQLITYYTNQHIKRICVLSVRKDPIWVSRLELWAKQSFAIQPEYARVARQAYGITVAYDKPEQLGIDRWAAMIAAYHSEKAIQHHADQSALNNLLVIDCGTAITVDWLANTGQHLAGMILPGLATAYFALEQHTGLKLNGAPKQNTNIVSALAVKTPNTQMAVHTGIDALFNSFFQQQIQAAQDHFHHAFRIYLTGGNALYFRHCFPAEKLQYQADLTLQGLRLIFH